MKNVGDESNQNSNQHLTVVANTFHLLDMISNILSPTLMKLRHQYPADFLGWSLNILESEQKVKKYKIKISFGFPIELKRE